MSQILRTAIGVFLALFMGITAAIAQDTGAPEYGDWRRVAARASEAIDNDRASEAAMDSLREQLVTWRATFEHESSRSRISVKTLEAQLDRLGSVPDAGDPEDVAEERRKLELALSEARAPTRKAELAQTESEELIRSIDGLLRDRQARLLLEPGPMPFMPGLWPMAVTEIGETVKLIGLEFQSGWVHEKQRNELHKSLPTILIYLALGLILLTRGMRWTEAALTRMIQDRANLSAARWVGVFFLSFGQVVLPMLGVFALSKAVYASDLAGLRGDVVLAILPLMTFELLVAKWLGARIFSIRSNALLKVNLTDSQKAAGRRAAAYLGIVLALHTLMVDLARYETWSRGTQDVVFFVLSAAAAVFLARLGVLVGRHAVTMRIQDTDQKTAMGQVIFLQSRFMIGASAVGAFLGVVGLTRGGSYLIFACTKTILLVAFLLIAQRVIQKIFAALEGRNDDESSLAAIFVGIGLVVASIPLLALTWGARVSDLQEFWTQISQGANFGDLVLSPRTVAVFVVVYFIGHAGTRLIQSFPRDNVLPKTSLDVGGQTAMVAGAGYVGIFLAALVALTMAGINLSNIALFAGALSIGIGFGLQTIVSNFVSGIILLIERPISEGDWIEVGGHMGYVRDISVRATRIETFDRTDVVVPNSDLIAGTVTNFTHGNTVGRVIVPVGVAYGTDTRRVEAILLEIASRHPMVLANPAPTIVFQGFGADSLDFEIRAILRDVNWVLTVKSDLNHEIARRFVEEDIEIPFAQRDVWLRNPETLRRDTAAPVEKAAAVAAPTKGVSQSMPTAPDLHDLTDGHAEVDAGDADGGDGR